MQKVIIKTVIVFLCITLWGCVTNQAAEQQQATSAPALSYPVVPDKAISMTVPYAKEKTLSLYGIELGESMASIENKYQLVGCRKDVFYLRCTVLLNTQGVSGVSVDDKTSLFLVLKNSQLDHMTMLVFPASLQQTRQRLSSIYGEPSSISDNKSTWSYAGGSIALEVNKNKTQPSIVKYSVD